MAANQANHGDRLFTRQDSLDARIQTGLTNVSLLPIPLAINENLGSKFDRINAVGQRIAIVGLV